MKKSKQVWIIAVLAAAGFSSCGIFKKDCGCPHFGKAKTDRRMDNHAAMQVSKMQAIKAFCRQHPA